MTESTPQAPAAFKVSRLSTVPLKHVWPMEATNFTPWLLDNADALSEVLGIEVQLDYREHKVGTFSLDLIGKESGSDRVVIVENQYGQTDHNHLGQILTYVGGTDPALIVWIAESFREEHRAAFDWLNASTPTGVGFFGIAVSAVRMQDGEQTLVAPRFELVCKPNEWEKLAKAEVNSSSEGGSSTGLGAQYKRFWETFVVEAKARQWTNATPPAQNWLSMPAGGGGNTFGVSYANFGCRSELYLGNSDPDTNFHRYEKLLARREEIQAAYGPDELNFDELPHAIACRIEARLEDGRKVSDESNWEDTIAWMVDTQTRLRAAIKSVGGVPMSTPGPPEV